MRAPIALLFAITFAVPAVAGAQDKATCVAAHEEGQVARKGVQLLRARERFRVCANDPCPAVLQRDCAVWHQQVDEAVPSLVFEARDDRGRDLEGVAVSIDGVAIAPRELSVPHDVDPGSHVVRFVLADKKVVERTVVVRTGEKGRVVALHVDAPKPEPLRAGPNAGGGVPPLAWVFGGVAVASLGVFGSFALMGMSKEDALESGATACSPFCAQRRLDPIKTDYLVADIGLGVSVVALGAAIYVLLSRSDAPPQSASTSRR